MARFTVRVELHNAESENYTLLYEHMVMQGFSDIITTDKGTKFEMPPGEYNFVGNLTKEQILAKAEFAAGETECEYSILVTQSGGRTWANLDKA